MTTGAGRLSRMSLRVRLVAGFAATMLVVLAAAGTFVYWRVQYALDRQLDAELTSSSRRLAPLVTAAGKLPQEPGLVSGERYQILDDRGRVLSHSDPGPVDPLLTPQATRAATAGPVTSDIGDFDVGDLLPDSSHALRVYAVPLQPRGGSATVLVVAAERNQRDEALRELLLQLVVAGVAVLLVTAVVGNVLAKASLGPVERYRRQAAEIAGGATGIRLDVPSNRDDEIARLGHTLNDMLRALEIAVEHERRFVNDASHELRTPLTLINTRVQLARRRPRTTDQYEAVLEEIQADIGRLSRLADQLLDVGTLNHSAESVDSSDLAATVRAEVERRRTLAPAESPYSRPGSLQAVTSGSANVAVSPRRLHQLLDNLLDNAAVHGAPPVTLTVDWIDRTCRLLVADAGKGMDADTLAAAPERFARAPEARSRPGSGLGLALVLAVVTAAGGELRLCFGGRHQRFGNELDVACGHGPAMTVTVLLPEATVLTSAAERDPAASDARQPLELSRSVVEGPDAHPRSEADR